MPVKNQMVHDGEITVEKGEFHGFPQHRTIPLRKPDVSVFSARELSLVDKVIATHRGKTALEMSDESHGFIGWKLADERETIPYAVAGVQRSDRCQRKKKITAGTLRGQRLTR